MGEPQYSTQRYLTTVPKLDTSTKEIDMASTTLPSDRWNAAAELTALMGTWWFNYDEWNPEVLRGLVAEDVTFSSRSDSGATDYEEFVTANLTGVDEVMAWQESHRIDSPYPLRHNGSNVHITDIEGDVAHFSSYIFVTKIVDGRPLSLSSGTACGAVRVTDRGLRLLRLEVVLDTTDSVPLGQHRDVAAQLH